MLRPQLAWPSCIVVALPLVQLIQALEAPVCKELIAISGKDLELLAQLKSLEGRLDSGNLPEYVHACVLGGDAGNLRDPKPTIKILIPHSRPEHAPARRGQGVEGASPEGDGFAVELPAGEASQEMPIEGEQMAEAGMLGEQKLGEEAGVEAGEEGGEEAEGEEGEEGEEEEFEYTDVDVGVGGMLLGSVAFVMLLFYFVNWQDDDIRRYSWSIISTTVSIFTSVLMFHGINNALMKILVDYCGLVESGYLLVLVAYTFFLVWFAAMQVVIGLETGAYATYAPINLLEETWTIANAMRWDYGMTVDPKYVRAPDARKSIADINQTELFVTKRKTEKEKMERRAIAVRTLFSHMTGFACIHAGVHLQALPFFSQSVGMAFAAVFINRVFLLFLFNVTLPSEAPRNEAATGTAEAEEDPHRMCAELCKDEVIEAENDIASLATSFLLVQAMRFALTGTLPNHEGLEEPPIPISMQTILSLYGLGLGCMVLVMMLIKSGLSARYKFLCVVQNTLGMSLSWCIFWSTRWVAAGSEALEKYKCGMETMEGRILLALTLSGVALAVIFCLDHLEDMSAGSASELSSVIQNCINALSILVGFSWEHSFDFSLEAVAHTTVNPNLAKLVFTGLVAFIITPAWRRYILVKVIQLNQLQAEEAKASSKRVEVKE